MKGKKEESIWTKCFVEQGSRQERNETGELEKQGILEKKNPETEKN